MKLEQLGRHILVEFYNCDSDILGNHEKIEKIMCEAAIKSNATIVTSCFHKFNPWGVSGAVIIQESHLEFIHGLNMDMHQWIYTLVEIQ